MRTDPAATPPPNAGLIASNGHGCASAPGPRSADGLGLAGLDLDRVEPRHLGAEVGADLLDLVVAVALAQLAGTRRRRRPSPRSSGSANAPVWMSVRTSFIVALTPSVTRGPHDVVAVLGGVADAEAHEVEPAAVHEVDDELELVHRLEVRELRLVAGLDERLEGGLDQRRDAAAQERLLAEQVGLGLLLERRLEDARARGAEAAGVGQDAGAGRARGVLLDREQRGHAAALLVHASAAGGRGPWARPCRRRSPPGGCDAPEPDVEAVGEHQQLARRAGWARSRAS